MISLYDWYKDAKGRVWCVVRIWAGDGNPAVVDLLEVGKPGPISQPEPVILKLIADKSFKKLSL